MAKAVIKFDLESPDDVMYLNRCMRSMDMALLLFHIGTNLREKCSEEIEALEADSDKWDGMEVCLRVINSMFEHYEINTDTFVK